MGRRIAQRACPTLVERPNDRDALDLADAEGKGEEIAVIEEAEMLAGASKILLPALVGAA